MDATDERRATRRSGRRAVLAALGANLAVAVAKFVGFLLTASASLLAEALHSVADSANEALLLFGAAQARHEPSPQHPFGYGRERYFWAFVVAVVLFTGGGLFALFEGEEKLRRPHELSSVPWAIGVLLAAMVFESLSLRTAVRRSRALKGDASWLGFVRRSKQAELTVVLLEDSAALLGLVFALVGVVLVEITGESRFDAIGSLAIGALLVGVAWLLAVEMKSFLIGESGAAEDVRAVRRVLEADERVARVVRLRTEQLGPEDLFVGAEIDLRLDRLTVEEVPRAIAELEREVRDRAPSARIVYLVPVAPGRRDDG